MALNFEYITTNGIRLHTVLAGPEDGDPVFLLHGFPDAWFGWEAHIKPLTDAGFRVIVPDQRGYNLSDKPKGYANYTMSTLVDDILGLADALGYDRFYLAGHDFGAMVSWNLAMRHPERAKRLVIANVPHPNVLGNYLRSHPKQILKSWYAIFFQIPKLPEWAVKLKNWHFLISAMPNSLTKEKRNRYRDAWGQPGAMTGMINWYRTSLRGMGKSAAISKIQVPTLILWGKQDPHISYEMASLSVEMCEEGSLVTFEDATHWVLHDEAEAISKHIVQYFSKDKQDEINESK
jgi:epoxide hydrolase 4